MKTRTYIACILSVLSMATYAQEDGQQQSKIRRASYGAGYSRLKLLDERISNQEMESLNAPFTFCYSIENDKSLFEYHFNGIIGNAYHPESPESGLIGSSTSLSVLQQAYVRYYARIGALSPGKFTFSLGGEVREQFFTSFADAPTFTFAEIGLNLSFLLSYQFNPEHGIKTYLGMPVVGTRVNLPNANMAEIVENGPDAPFSDAEFMLINPWRYKGANFSIEYVRRLSDEWNIACVYDIYSYRLEENSQVRFRHGGLIMKLVRTL